MEDKEREEYERELKLAHKAVTVLGEAVYKYKGGTITLDELTNIVKAILNKDLIEVLEHAYIIKDYNYKFDDQVDEADDSDSFSNIKD